MNHLATIDSPRATRFDPDARAYEAFDLGLDERGCTSLLNPIEATDLRNALAELTSRQAFDRGDRVGVREIGPDCDRLHVYACRRSSQLGSRPSRDLMRMEPIYKRRFEHICTIDLRVVAGELVGLNENPSLAEHQRKRHAERQAQRPEGARLSTATGGGR